jgi:carbamoyltransferase
MHILGISCFYHDAAAAILRDGTLLAAAEEERFTRIKHDFGFPRKAIRFCLKAAAITAHDLDYVVFYEKPFHKFERILMTTLQGFPRSWKSFREAMINWLGDKLWIKSLIKEELEVEDGKILFAEHHLSHAASAFYASPFKEAAILTVDGVGEWTTAAMGLGRGTNIKLLQEIPFPHSLGLLYSAFTAFLGFQVNEGEYKVMGMAPYGRPLHAETITRRLIRVAPDGSFWLNMDYFAYHLSDEKTFNSRFQKLFGEPRDPDLHFFTAGMRYPSYFGDKPADYSEICRRNQHYADVAASIQRVTEEVLLKLVRTLHRQTGLTKLCLAGGVALNSVANGRILRETPFQELFIQPAAGDGGGALGAALYAHHGLLGKPRSFVMEHAYWGQEYPDREVKEFLEKNSIPYEPLAEEGQAVDRIVDALLKGKVVGLVQGRFEWGPRALGNRSILADPRREEMKDLVNIKIKFREPFRPFAPVLPEQHVSDFFQGEGLAGQYPSRYMLLVLPLREDRADSIAAVNHLGTGRLQAVRREWNPRYYRIIEDFGKATGIPVLLNTSFNLRGEPIVNTPADAFHTFRHSGLDVLVLGNYWLEK